MQVAVLVLGGCQVTDSGLEHLMGLMNLKELGLSYTTITDADLMHLKGLKRLEVFDFEGTNITDAGVAELKKALPNCEISY